MTFLKFVHFIYWLNHLNILILLLDRTDVPFTVIFRPSHGLTVITVLKKLISRLPHLCLLLHSGLKVIRILHYLRYRLLILDNFLLQSHLITYSFFRYRHWLLTDIIVLLIFS